MAIGISTIVRNAAADAITALFDGGTGRVNIYTGTPPSPASVAATGTLLATLILNTDAASPAVTGVATFNAITSDVSADNSGTALWFRIYNSDETAPGSTGTGTDARVDGSCGSESSGANLVFTDRDGGATAGNIFVQGGTVTISGFSFTMPPS